MTDKKKNHALTLFDKEKIIKFVEQQEMMGGKPNLTDVAKKFDCHRTTISKIIKNKEEYKSRIQYDTQSPTSTRKGNSSLKT